MPALVIWMYDDKPIQNAGAILITKASPMYVYGDGCSMQGQLTQKWIVRHNCVCD